MMSASEEEDVVLLSEKEGSKRQAAAGRENSTVEAGNPPRAAAVTTNLFVVAAASVAALGGVLFGYDVGIVSGAMLQIGPHFSLTCQQRELVVSSMLFGAVVASLTGGYLVDHLGRRFSIIVNALVFVVGAAILTFANSFAVLICGRLVVGFAVSLSAIAECCYIGEVAPAKKRGLLVSLNELGITLGLMVAYAVQYIFIDTQDGWRFMFGLSAVPAVLQGAAMFFLPKSPRYLMLLKQEEKALEVLEKLRGRDAAVDRELNNIRLSLTFERHFTTADLFRKLDNLRSTMVIAAGLVFFQQMTGQPNVLYYAPTVIQLLGFKTDSASTALTLALGAVKVLSTTLALALVDSAGRRRFLLTGTVVMMVSVAVLGGVVHRQQQTALARGFSVSAPSPCEQPFSTDATESLTNTSKPTIIADNTLDYTQPTETGDLILETTTHFSTQSFSGITVPLTTLNSTQNVTGDVGGRVGVDDGVSKWIVLSALVLYVAAYSFGFGPITWLVLSEIFPAGVKGRAVALATVLNWGTNVVVSGTFLESLETFGVAGVFSGYAVMCLLATVFAFLLLPETKGKSLERISHELRTTSLKERAAANLRSLSCLRPGSAMYLRLTGNYQQMETHHKQRAVSSATSPV